MAVFTAANNAVRFDLFNVAGLLTGTTDTSDPTEFTRRIDPDNFTTFIGTGFTYSGGIFNAGTIQRIDSVAASQLDFQFVGLSMPVAQFRAFVNAGSSQGFLAAALAGNDSLTGSAFDDYLQGFAGNDLIQNDPGNDDNDTLDGGTGNDSLVGADGEDFLLGAIGNDVLNAGSGGDTLDGGVGADTMDGGDGNDVYFVDNLKDSIVADSSGFDTVRSTVSFTLGVTLEHLFLTGGGALNGTGNALANQIVGTSGANSLLGLGADDLLEGGGGNDKLDGGTESDTMLGGAGNDTYFVDSQLDQATETIAGAAGGKDIVFSSANFILLGANIENLTLIAAAQAGAGNALNNLIIGNAENNELHGLGGNDTLIGGAGNDTYHVNNAADQVTESLAGPAGGADIVMYEGSAGYTLGNNLEILNMFKSSGATFGIGNGLANTLVGNNSANTLDGKAGVDDLIGLGGDDIYIVDNTLDVVDEESGGSGIDTVRSSVDFNLNANGTTVLGDFEHLTLLGKALTGTGNALDNQITGNAGKNFLSGLGGGDTLDGGAGNDTLVGGDGSDLYVIDSKFDVVSETGADIADQINSSKISVDISAAALLNIEHIELQGKAALNAIGNGSKNAITGNDGANKLFGLGGDDTLVGGGGNDTLDGGAGMDHCKGGAGNDTYITDHSDGFFAYINEVDGSGIDTVISSTHFSLAVDASGDVENLVLTGAGNLTGLGNVLANAMTGNEGANLMLGNFGNDTIAGGAGNDTLTGGEDDDSIDGGTGNDLIGGELGNDTITGGAGDDVLAGFEGDDVINVATGNDVVKFATVLDGHDLITGFDGNAAGGQDVLDLVNVFDLLVIPSAERASHVMIVDYGSTVDIRIDADKNLINGYELTVATIQTTDAVTIGQDVLLG